MVTGVRRTAEELGRAFPGVPVLMSKGDAVRSEIDSAPALVVATPGAEPFVADGYSAALLLDATAMLGRPGLRAAEEALRRWLRAAVLVRTGARGGQVVIVAAAEASAVQALVRWDPAGFAARELTERTALRLPPAVRLAELTGTASDISDLLAYAQLPDGAEVLGAAQAEVSVAAEASSGQAEVSVAAEASSGQAEVSVAAEASEDQARIVIRVPRSSGTALGTALRAAAGVRSARRNGGPVRVRVDPVDLG
jgi:primosomal protein N' (replication factor Y)